jgi:hypothetical protein
MSRLPFLLLPVLLALAQPLHAQLYLGVEGGWNKNHLSTSNSSQYFTENVDQPGFSAGIPVRYRILDWLAVAVDPSCIQKNYKSQRTGFFNGVYQMNTNSYWQLPVMAQLSFGGQQLRGYLGLGGYVAYWASSRIKGTTVGPLNSVDTVYTTVNPIGITGESIPYHFDQKYAFNSTRDNRVELGCLAALGISYELPRGYFFFIEGRYTQSLTDQQKNYQLNQTPRYNDTYGLSAGCLFRLNQWFGRKQRRNPKK